MRLRGLDARLVVAMAAAINLTTKHGEEVVSLDIRANLLLIVVCGLSPSSIIIGLVVHPSRGHGDL